MEAHDCGRILIRTSRSSSLLYTLRSSYLHNWLMFLCEVGMNNTLVGLLHPQADEKMFNFSKCSAPSLFLSVSFPSLWLFVSAGLCLWVFTCWRPEECCWFASSVFTVGFKRMLSITNKRQHLHLQTRMNKLVVWAQHCSINWYNFKSCVTFTGLLALREKSSPSDFFFNVCVCVCTLHQNVLERPFVIS